MIASGEAGIGGGRVLGRRLDWRAALVVVVGVLEVALLLSWQGNAYVNFSDGVYAQSAREFLHGVVPYRDFAAAQPPPVFLLGAVLLAVSDGAGVLHVSLGLVDLLTAWLVGICVWRLDGRVWPACLAALVAPLLPISLNAHAQLIPETLAAPLLLAGAMTCARAERQVLGGALLAVAVWCKLAFVIPALAIAIASPASRRALVMMAGASVGLFLASVAAFGTGVWRETVIAQFQVGQAPLHYSAGLLAQAAWNELPLGIGLLTFLVLFVKGKRLKPREPALARTLIAAAMGGLLLGLTVLKRGSYIDVLIVAEPPLLVLGVCAAASIWPASKRAQAAILLIGIFLTAQTASLLLHPSNPWAAVRPLAASGLAWTASPSQVDRAVAAARRCPQGLAYAGNPYIAFLASRRMPGLQPDLFMLSHATEDATFARRAARDKPTCP